MKTQAPKSLRELGDGRRIEGICEPGFEPVLDAFEANFREHGEVGASCCVIENGRNVVDLWGGFADADRQDPWQRDTASIVFSCTKGAAALCLHLLVQDQGISYDDKVETVWPDFSRGGKAGTTIGMMLDHRSPVPHLREPIPQDGFLDWDGMIRRMENEEAFWEPGTRQGYHGITYAWTVGNVVRLVSGQPLGQFFRERVARPCGLNFHIGLRDEDKVHLARIIPAERGEIDFDNPFYRSATHDRTSPAGLFLYNLGKAQFDSPAYHRAEIASANGITNARGLAGLYSAMIAADGLLNAQTLDRLKKPTAVCQQDAVLCRPSAFSGGFMKRMPSVGASFDGLLIPDAAFGHVGMGGSIGFADPDRGIGFGYTMNRLGPTVLLNTRGQALIDALLKG